MTGGQFFYVLILSIYDLRRRPALSVYSPPSAAQRYWVASWLSFTSAAVLRAVTLGTTQSHAAHESAGSDSPTGGDGSAWPLGRK